MAATTDTRNTTDYLRGLGIMLVIITHYAAQYPDLYNDYLSNYGNAFMAVFFVLAGLGAWHSFQKRFAAAVPNATPTRRVVLKYYFDRVLRIYPLYWLALLLTQLFAPQFFPAQDTGLLSMIGVITAFPLTVTPFWFVTSIVQCYLLAPPLYLLFRRLGLAKFALFNTLLAAALIAISIGYTDLLAWLEDLTTLTLSDPGVLLYREVFLGNILLFSLGLMLPMLVRIYGHRMKRLTMFFAAAALLGGLSWLLRYNVLTLKQYEQPMELLYFLGVFLFCWVSLAVRPPLPFKGAVNLAGKNSYALYLFHAILFAALIQQYMYQEQLLKSLAIAVLSFPFLVWFCSLAEQGSRYLGSRLISRLASRRNQPAPAEIH